MTIKLGDFFPKKSVDEPILELDDPRWATLEGGYKGTLYDASMALKKLELTDNKEAVNLIYQELWNELHHQGDVGLASYYSVPHLVRIALQKQIVDSNILGLVSVIEIQRHKNNPQIPTSLKPNYSKAIEDLADLTKLAMGQYWNLDLAITTLTAIALAKGQVKLAHAIQNMDSEDVIDEFLESYSQPSVGVRCAKAAQGYLVDYNRSGSSAEITINKNTRAPAKVYHFAQLGK